MPQDRILNYRFLEFMFEIREPEVWQKMVLEASDLIALHGLERCDPPLVKVEGVGRDARQETAPDCPWSIYMRSLVGNGTGPPVRAGLSLSMWKMF